MLVILHVDTETSGIEKQLHIRFCGPITFLTNYVNFLFRNVLFRILVYVLRAVARSTGLLHLTEHFLFEDVF